MPACRNCNADKGSQNMEEWYKKQEFFDDLKFIKLVEWTQQDLSEVICMNSYNPYRDIVSA